MFALDKRLCTIRGVNGRIEKHGEEDVLAADVSFVASLPNTDLDMLDAGLLEALYLPPDAAQASVDGVSPVSTRLRCSILKPVGLQYKLEGREVTVVSGSGLVTVLLRTAKIGKFELDAMEGGTVKVFFQAQAAHMGDAQIGELFGMLGQQVAVSIAVSVPPADEKQAELAAAAGEATSAFLGSVAAKSKLKKDDPHGDGPTGSA